MDKITASLATMPDRAHALENVVEALAPQVDRLHVYLNGHDEVPGCIRRHRNVVPHGTPCCEPDLKGAGRFFPLSGVEGYVLLCDDDLFYPPTYVADMVGGIKRYRRKALVCLGGKRFDKTPVASYYRDPSLRLQLFRDLQQDTPTHTPLACTVAFHTDAVTLTLVDVEAAGGPTGNEDVDIGLVLQQRNVPCIALKHRRDYITHQKINFDNTTYRKFVNNDGDFTKAVNSVRWRDF